MMTALKVDTIFCYIKGKFYIHDSRQETLLKGFSNILPDSDKRRVMYFECTYLCFLARIVP